MNLGDGLMFELENGKPKLVLAPHGKSKASSKMGFSQQVPQRNRALKTTVPSKQCPKEADQAPRFRKGRDVGGENQAEHGIRGTKEKSVRNHVNGAVRMESESRTRSADEPLDILEKAVKESMACLTQEQLQQILNSITAPGQTLQDNSTTHTQNGQTTTEKCTSSETVSGTELPLNRSRSSQGQEDEKKPSESTSSGLFSTLGERELQREALEAKRAEWRKELDKQLALKMQQKENTRVLPQSEQSKATSSADQLAEVKQDRIMKTNTKTQKDRPATPQTHSNPRALPPAIRSAFVLGEATPLEHAFNDEKREEQKRWLQGLEQQREEAKLRKKLEKQNQNQAEDHELWNMHFDSLKHRVPVQSLPVPGSDRTESCVGSSLSNQRPPSQALSTPSTSAHGGDGLDRASVDTTQGLQPKSSYLRTMTALLDPAQIEERARKRFKQLEHQRAIEAQVEERKRQKEKEEAARRALEQEEERRVAQERDLLEQQYLKDKQLQRQKEELHSRRREELFRSIQKAQEEAQKDKHLHRIQERSKKGLDVSSMLPNVAGESASQGSVSLTAFDTTTHRAELQHTGRKDRAVQTEVNTETPSPDMELFIKANGGVHAPAVHKAPPNIKKARRDARLAEKNSGKENMRMFTKESDPYEPYARTDRIHGQQLDQRPDWNTQRPAKAFVPASERYPAALQRHRQESRMRRQMELMTLVERNALSRAAQQGSSAPHSENPPHLSQNIHSAQRKGEDSRRPPCTPPSKAPSPLIPALKHRHHHPPSRTEEHGERAGWPPLSDYVPYVRTDEVYHLDPLAPISRPTTHEAQQKTHTDVISSRQPPPLVQRDPLFHPDVLKSTDRQRAILKGLSELREGLLQKQRELETSLSPLLVEPSRSHSAT